MFGEATDAAVRAFQESVGLPVTGEVIVYIDSETNTTTFLAPYTDEVVQQIVQQQPGMTGEGDPAENEYAQALARRIAELTTQIEAMSESEETPVTE